MVKPARVLSDIAAGQVPDTQGKWCEALLDSDYDQRMMYVPLSGWHWWDPRGVWRHDVEGTTVCGMLKTFVQMYREAPYNDPDPDRQKKLVGLVSKADNDGYIKSIEHLFRSDVAVDIHKLDRRSWLLNTPAGIADLSTGEVFAHDPTQHMTMMTRGSYNPEALRTSQWLKVIQEIVPNPERRAYLQEMLGVGLVGETIEQIALLLYGPTARNGKSTVGEAIQHAMGDYSSTGDPGILTKTDKHEENIAALHRKRIVQFSELPEDKTLAAAGFKRLTGDDTISARHLFKGRFDYTPGFTMVIRANDLPYVPGDDEGTWRRIRVILFDQQFNGSRDNRGLRNKLRSDPAELDAIITWMMDGLRRYLRRDERVRYVEPICVSDDTNELRDQNDSVGQFLRERLEPAPVDASGRVAFLSYNDIWMAYAAWHATQSEKPAMSQAALTKKLKKRSGIMHTRIPTGRGISGMRFIGSSVSASSS
jgi:putative DNA primase/helicase